MSNHTIRIRIWDTPTRLFHWSLAVLVSTGLITGFLTPEWWLDVHLWAGYGTLLLIIFRLVWGVFGSEYSRFETFTFTPGQIFSHMRELVLLRPSRHMGHNPAGSVMIFTLLLLLFAIEISGLAELGGEENQGPLAGIVNFHIGAIAAEIHLAAAIILMVLIAIHVLGVFLEMSLTGENLVKAMIDGFKIIPEGKIVPRMRPSRPVVTSVFLLTFAALACAVLWPLSAIAPSGIIESVENRNFTGECQECHEVYHPSLLPKASWAILMENLGDHFGEDASIDRDIGANIAAYLETNAAEAWDTEASNRLSKVSPGAPYQITAVAYWKDKHGDIRPDVFKRKSVGGKSHCASCHLDAASGHFDDQKIKIPTQ